jgi:tRNA pseudouridine38-40 synthase
MPILASGLKCWYALNRGFWSTRIYSRACTQYSVRADSERNPSMKRDADETLDWSPKKRHLDDEPPTDVGNVKRGSEPESDRISQKSSGVQAQTGKKKDKKRGRRAREEVERAPRIDEEGNVIPKTPRYPKRQCALLLGFCGSGYSGMQMCGMDHLSTVWRILMFC